MNVKLSQGARKIIRFILLLLMAIVILYLSFIFLNVRYIDKEDNILTLSGEGLTALVGGLITMLVVINDVTFKLKPKKKIPVLVFLIIIIFFSVVYDLGIEQIFNRHGYSECYHIIRKDLVNVFVKNKNNCDLERSRWN